MKKIISCLICFTLFFQQSGFCQMLDLSGLITRTQFVPDISIRPPHLRSFGFEPGTSFTVQVDKGDGEQPKEMKAITQELMKYFLIGLTLPDSAFWVNLRPDSPDNVIDPELARTEIGRIFLEADLELKKDVARYTSPQTDAGRKYWNLLYEKAEQIYGDASSIEIPTVTRPWIVPGEIVLGDMGQSAFIYKANLNVLLEADYLKNAASSPKFNDGRIAALNEYSSELIKKLIMPLIINDVNTAKRYASLRQVYYSLILAQWYKEKFNSAQTPFSSRINSRDLSGLTSTKPADVSQYFNAYARSYANGEYSIKESAATGFGMQVRTYVSGGIKMDGGSFKTAVISSLKKIIFYPFTRIFKGTDQLFLEELQPAEYTASPRLASGANTVSLYQQAQGLERMNYVWPAMTRAEAQELVDFYWRGSKRTHNIVWQDLTTSRVKALIEYQPPEYLSRMIRVEDLGVLRLLPGKKLVEMALANLIGKKDIVVEFYRNKPIIVVASGILGLGLVLAGINWWDQDHSSSLAVNETNPVVTQAIASAALDTAYVATVTPDFSLLAEPNLSTLQEKIKETRTIPTPTNTITDSGSDDPFSAVISEITPTPAPTLTPTSTPTLTPTPTITPAPEPQTWSEVTNNANTCNYNVGVNKTVISVQKSVISSKTPLDTSLNLVTKVITEVPYTTGEQKTVTYLQGSPGYVDRLEWIEQVISDTLEVGISEGKFETQSELLNTVQAQRLVDNFIGWIEVSNSLSYNHVLSAQSHISTVSHAASGHEPLYTSLDRTTGVIIQIPYTTGELKAVAYQRGSEGHVWSLEQMLSTVDYAINLGTNLPADQIKTLKDTKAALLKWKTTPTLTLTPTPTPTITPTPTPWVNDQTWSLVTDAAGVTSYKIGLNSTVISVQKSIMSAKFPVDTSVNIGTRVITEIPYTTGELKTVTYQPGSVGYAEKLKFIENVISDGLEVGIRYGTFETQAELLNTVQAQRLVDNFIGWIEVSNSLSYNHVLSAQSHISTRMAVASAHPPLYTSLDRTTGVIIQIPYTTGQLNAVALLPGSAEYVWPLEHMLSTVDKAIDLGTNLPKAQVQELKDTKIALQKWQVTSTPTLTPTPTAEQKKVSVVTPEKTPAIVKPVKTQTSRPIKEPTVVPTNTGIPGKKGPKKDGGNVDDNLLDPNGLGGIDLRMPLPTTTIFPAQLIAKIAQLSTSVTDIESEWANIEEYAKAGIHPSQERLREFLIACCKQGVITDYSERMLICLAKVLRAEEKDVVATSPELRNMLMIVQAN